MDTLFTIDAIPQQWVVRHAVTGREFMRSDDATDCELWCDQHRSETWLVIERVNQCLSLDQYLLRGMLRNYPGERRQPVDPQLDLFATT